MSIILVGGMDRLGEKYQQEARRTGIKLFIFSQAGHNMGCKIKGADAVVIFTNKVSHHARNEAVTAAKRHGIPVFMHHACGVCTLRECLKCIQIFHEAQGTTDANPMQKAEKLR